MVPPWTRLEAVDLLGHLLDGVGQLLGSAGRQDHRHGGLGPGGGPAERAQHGVDAVPVGVLGEDLPHRQVAAPVAGLVVGQEFLQSRRGVRGGLAELDEIPEHLLQRAGVTGDDRGRAGGQFEDPPGTHRR
jgi:hypothetical protein